MNLSRLAVLSLAVVTLTGSAATVMAQASQPKGLSARVGILFPSNGAARDQSKTWLAAGLDYRLGYIGQKNIANRDVAGFTSISVDWFGSGSYSSLPVMFNYTFRQDSLYAGAGAGIAFQRKPEQVGTDTNSRFAFQLNVGYDFVKQNQPYFAELRYWGGSSAQHTGFGVYGGIRF